MAILTLQDIDPSLAIDRDAADPGEPDVGVIRVPQSEILMQGQLGKIGEVSRSVTDGRGAAGTERNRHRQDKSKRGYRYLDAWAAMRGMGSSHPDL